MSEDQPMDAARGAGTLDHFTVAVRVKPLPQTGPLVRSATGETILSIAPLASPSAYRERRRFKSDLALTCTWRTDPLSERVIPEYYAQPDRFVWHVKPSNLASGTLIVQAPIDLVGGRGWIDLLFIHDGLHLQLWADGVLVDEEWPQGPTRNVELPLTVAPERSDEVDALTCWRRGLTAREIRSRSGEEMASRRTTEINPPHRGTWQYWRPPDYNAYVGDCMPFFHDGVLHLYYLYDRRHHQAKWGAGAHQFAHLSTRDLVHWAEHPLALPLERAAEGSIGTGNCIQHEGVFHIYWIEHARRIPFKEARYHADNIFVARGTDAITFKREPAPWLRLDYGRSGDINSFVFRDAANDRFYQVLGGAGVLDGTVTERAYESTDLETWAPTGTLTSVGPLSVCPSYIEWRGYHYLFSVCYYYLSDRPPSQNQFRLSAHVLERGLIAPMIVRFKDDRALLVGAKGQQGYAGRLVIRELVQLEDGELATRFVEEMLPERDGPAPLARFVAAGQANTAESGFLLNDAAPRLRFEGLPHAYHLAFTVQSTPGPSHWGLLVRGASDDRSGYEIRFRPGDDLVEFRPSPEAPPHGASRPLPLNLSERFEGLQHRFTVDLLVFDDLVDVCIDGRYTHLGEAPEAPDALTIRRIEGDLTLSSIVLRPFTTSNGVRP